MAGLTVPERRAEVVRLRAEHTGTGVRFQGASPQDLVQGVETVVPRFLRSSLSQLRFYVIEAKGTRTRVTLERGHQLRARPSCDVLIERGVSFGGLSPSEHRIASLVAAGNTNAQAALQCACTPRTVEKHLSNILGKLGLPSRAALASLVAARSGWVHPVCLDGGAGSFLEELAVLGPETAPAGGDGLGLAAAESQERVFRIGALIEGVAPRKHDVRAMMMGQDYAVERLSGSATVPATCRVQLTRALTSPERREEDLRALLATGIDALIIGNTSTRGLSSLFDLVTEDGLPTVHSMVNESLARYVDFRSRRSSVFQMCSDESVYVRAFTEFIDEHMNVVSLRNGEGVALVVRHDDLGLSTRDSLVQSLRERHGIDPLVITYDDGAEEWATVALELHQADAQVVYLGIYIEQALVDLLRHFRTLGYDPLKYCVWAPGIPGFIDRNAELAEGLVWTTLVGNSNNYLGRQFEAGFRERYAEEPGIGSAAVHYDMVNLLVEAWRANGFSGDAAGLNRRISELVFHGVTGTYHFDQGRRKTLCYPYDTDDPTIGQPFLSFRIRRGRHVLLSS